MSEYGWKRSEFGRNWSESVGILKVIKNNFSFVSNRSDMSEKVGIGRNWSESMVGNVGCTYGGGTLWGHVGFPIFSVYVMRTVDN